MSFNRSVEETGTRAKSAVEEVRMLEGAKAAVEKSCSTPEVTSSSSSRYVCCCSYRWCWPWSRTGRGRGAARPLAIGAHVANNALVLPLVNFDGAGLNTPSVFRWLGPAATYLDLSSTAVVSVVFYLLVSKVLKRERPTSRSEGDGAVGSLPKNLSTETR